MIAPPSPTLRWQLGRRLLRRIIKQGSLRWDADRGRYVNARTGNPINQQRIDDILDAYAGAARRRIGALANELTAGNIRLSEWQRLMAREIKDVNVAMLVLGRGGKAATAFQDYGRVGAHIKKQYGFLDRFAGQIKRGALTPGQIRVRAEMYAGSSREAYYTGRRGAMEEAEYTEERREIRPGENCPECLDYAGQGWVPLNTLPPPGSESRCLSNCNCVMLFR